MENCKFNINTKLDTKKFDEVDRKVLVVIYNKVDKVLQI